jgi:soluble lytic murein transglycosylase-like protein
LSIDPRIMRTLLQLQFMPTIDFSSGDVTGSSDSADQSSTTSLFNTLLQQMMGGSDPAGSTPGMSLDNAGVSGIPAELLALNSGVTADMLPQMESVSAQAPGSSNAGRQTEYEPLIAAAAAKYGVDPSLVKGVIQTESSFNPNAGSAAGAKGLMQLMDGTAQGLGVTDSFDPVQNIEGGTRFLSYLINKYQGNVKAALAAYNAGPGRVDRLGIQTDEDVMNKMEQLPVETQRYIGKVLNARSSYQL